MVKPVSVRMVIVFHKWRDVSVMTATLATSIQNLVNPIAVMNWALTVLMDNVLRLKYAPAIPGMRGMKDLAIYAKKRSMLACNIVPS